MLRWRTLFLASILQWVPRFFLIKNLCKSLVSRISLQLFFRRWMRGEFFWNYFETLNEGRKSHHGFEMNQKNEDIVERIVAEKIKAVLARTYAFINTNQYGIEIKVGASESWRQTLFHYWSCRKIFAWPLKSIFCVHVLYLRARLRKTQLCHNEILFFQLSTTNLLLENACWMPQMSGRKNGENEMFYLCWAVERQYRKCIIAAASFRESKLCGLIILFFCFLHFPLKSFTT